MEKTWSIGELDRSFWIDQGVFSFPISGDSSGNLYEHETNSIQTSPNNTAVPFCKSGPIQISQGDNLVQVNQIVPDSDANNLPGVTLGFKGKIPWGQKQILETLLLKQMATQTLDLPPGKLT